MGATDTRQESAKIKADYLASVEESIRSRFTHVTDGVIAVHFHDRWPAEAVDCWITIGQDADPAIINTIHNWIHGRGPVRTWNGDLHFYVRQAKPVGEKSPPSVDPRREVFWSAAFCAALTTRMVESAASVADLALAEWDCRWGGAK